MATADAYDVALFEFTADQARDLVHALGFSVRKGIIRQPDKRPAHFYCCKRSARVKNLGHIMPGSMRLICDDPVCINAYVAETVTG